MMMATPVVADEKPILLHIDEGSRVAEITFNRPRCLNAINLPFLKMLVEGLEKVKSSCAKVCIVQSSSKHFCSGEDLKQTLAPASKGKDSDELRHSLELLQDITRLMTTSSAIFIACVEGWAIGGGAEIALAADLVIAGNSAIFKFPEVSIGHAPTGGITARLPQLLGLQLAKKALLLGDPIPANSHLGLKLVTEIADDPLKRSQAIATRIASYSTHSLRTVKLSTECAVFPDATGILQREVSEASICFADPIAQEAFSAFQTKKSMNSSFNQSDGRKGNDTASDTLITLMQRQCETHNNRPFLRFGSNDVTYSQFMDSVRELAAGLLSCGTRSKDVVAAMMQNSADMVTLWFATMWIGAIWAPLHTEFRGTVLRRALDLIDPKLMLVDECFLKFLPKDYPIPIVLNGPEAYKHRTLSALRSNLRAEASPAGHDETASLLFTSGTSGPSKACELTHEYFINAAKRLVTSLELRSDDVLFCPFPLYHADATSFTVVPALLLGATAAISQRFSASGWWNEIRQTRSTVADFMGATLSILYKAEPTPSDPDNPLRIMWGVPVPSWVEEFEKRFALKVHEVYGSTETGLPVVQNINKPRVQGSCGVALQNAELKIVDENMQEVQSGVVGELLVRQPPEFMFSGYYNNTMATVSSEAGSWYRTGDLCRMDANGNLYFVTRRKFVIRRRGENISAFEVEETLLKHADVMGCAAYGVESELTEEDVMVSVVLRPGSTLSAEEIFTYALENLGRHQVPRYIEIVDTLPRTATGKLEVHSIKSGWKGRENVKEFTLPRRMDSTSVIA